MTPAFESSYNPIPTRGADYPHHITTCTPGFENLTTALHITSSADTKQNGLGWNLNEMLDHEVDMDTTSYHLVQTKVNIKCIQLLSYSYVHSSKAMKYIRSFA